MQIIPTNKVDADYGFFSSMGDNNGSNFFEAMQGALDAVQDGDYVSATNALKDETRQPLVESPYTRHTTDGVTYTLDEVCFTKQELLDLRAQLVKEGAPEETLRQFDILADQPDGATLAQVMASLVAKSAPVNFSEDDAATVTALLGQIDPSGQLAADAIDLMNRGNGSAALDLIQNALGSMDFGDTIDIGRDELLALGRGLGLNTDSMRQLASSIGDRSVTVNAAQFDTLMNPAKNQFATEAANAQKLDAALEKTLKPLIRKARNRMEKEKAASELSNRRVEQSRVLIDKTVQERSREIIDQTASGDTAANVADRNEAIAKKLQNQHDHGDATRQNNNRPETASENNSHNADNDEAIARRLQNQGDTTRQNNIQQFGGTDKANIPVTRDDARQNTGFGQNNRQNLQHNKQDQQFTDSEKENKLSEAWNSLLNKIETRPAFSSANTANSLVYSMLQGQTEFEPALFSPELTGNMPHLAQQVVNQVEQGLLSAMQDGATRLDLQLHPAELGALTITLIARNGEVTAQIRSEKSETAELVNRQLDTIRVNLEQQGVKVDKIEVQIENRKEDGNNSFQDLGQHNARQEENARRQELSRLRNLAAIRNSGLNSENNVLAQSVHNIEHTARYAGQPLHVVA